MHPIVPTTPPGLSAQVDEEEKRLKANVSGPEGEELFLPVEQLERKRFFGFFRGQRLLFALYSSQTLVGLVCLSPPLRER